MLNLWQERYRERLDRETEEHAVDPARPMQDVLAYEDREREEYREYVAERHDG